MSTFQETAQQYDKAANRILTRYEGKMTKELQDRVAQLRADADAVRALIRPEDSQPKEIEWHLNRDEVVAKSQKFKAKDSKVASPQELIKRAQQ